jgi:hypothetical protein
MTTNSGGLPLRSVFGNLRVTGAAAGAFTPGVSVVDGSGVTLGVALGVLPGVLLGVFVGLWFEVGAVGWSAPGPAPSSGTSAQPPTSAAITTEQVSKRSTAGLTT